MPKSGKSRVVAAIAREPTVTLGWDEDWDNSTPSWEDERWDDWGSGSWEDDWEDIS